MPVKPCELVNFPDSAPVNQDTIARSGEEAVVEEGANVRGNLDGLARKFQPIGIKSLRHQRPLAQEQHLPRIRNLTKAHTLARRWLPAVVWSPAPPVWY